MEVLTNSPFSWRFGINRSRKSTISLRLGSILLLFVSRILIYLFFQVVYHLAIFEALKRFLWAFTIKIKSPSILNGCKGVRPSCFTNGRYNAVIGVFSSIRLFLFFVLFQEKKQAQNRAISGLVVAIATYRCVSGGAFYKSYTLYKQYR